VHGGRKTVIAAGRGLAKALVRFIRARWKLLLLLFFGVGLPLVAFGDLAQDVYRRGGILWDEPILRYVHRHETPGRDAAMAFISDIGHLYGVVPLAVLCVLALLVARRRGNALFFAVAVGGAGLLNQAAKTFFQRDRPELWLSPSPAPEHTYSFPSGHAMGSMALVAALAVLAWPTRWRWWAILLGGIFTLLVGFSRVYLGVHYPSDVVAGWSASLAWVLGVSQAAYGHLVKTRPRATPAAAGPDPSPPPADGA
jgi:membrane-associated phospholipid phosphatase